MRIHIYKEKTITVLLLAAAMSVILTGCGEDAESNLSQGMAALSEGNYDAAKTFFYAAEDNGEGEKQAERAIGMTYLAEGDYENAIKSFENALSLSNGIIEDMDIDISYYLAVAKYRSGDEGGAIETYDSIIDIRPDEDNAYYLRGKAYLSSGDKEKALADYEQAVTLSPDDYDHYVRICEDLREAGYESEGDSYIRRAMEDNSKLSDYQLGIFNYYLGNYSDARNYLENARDDKNSGADLIMYLGKTYEALGDPGYAISLYESAIAEGNADGGIYVSMGLCKMQQGDYEGAIDTFETGIAGGYAAYMQSLLYNRIVAYEYLRDFSTAKSLMAEYVQKYPGDEKAARENIFLSTR